MQERRHKMNYVQCGHGSTWNYCLDPKSCRNDATKEEGALKLFLIGEE